MIWIYNGDTRLSTISDHFAHRAIRAWASRKSCLVLMHFLGGAQHHLACGDDSYHSDTRDGFFGFGLYHGLPHYKTGFKPQKKSNSDFDGRVLVGSNIRCMYQPPEFVGDLYWNIHLSEPMFLTRTQFGPMSKPSKLFDRQEDPAIHAGWVARSN